jgi:hypothetical protein
MAINGNGAPSESQVSGIVRAVNDKGLRLDGYETWFNISKFAVGCVLPERGQHVTCTLDKSGFLRAVVATDGADIAPLRSVAPSASSGDRERTITRLAVLKAAAEFGAARGTLKSGDVLAIAASWEKWIMREQETTYDLADDAF